MNHLHHNIPVVGLVLFRDKYFLIRPVVRPETHFVSDYPCPIPYPRNKMLTNVFLGAGLRTSCPWIVPSIISRRNKQCKRMYALYTG